MDTKESYEALEWQIMRSIRYHERRERFFKIWHTIVMSAVVLAGAYGIVMLGFKIDLPTWIKLAPMVILSVFSAIDVVVGFATKAALYNELKRRFIKIQIKMIDMRDNQEGIDQLMKDVLTIELDEPPILDILNIICHNEVATIKGEEDRMVKLTSVQRLLAPLLDWQLDKVHGSEAR